MEKGVKVQNKRETNMVEEGGEKKP